MTITDQHEQKDIFQALIVKLYGEFNDNDPLSKFRTKAWERFVQLGLPSRSDDVYRYIRLRNLFSNHYEAAHPVDVNPKAIDPLILPECKDSVLVFVNGHFMAHLSRTAAINKKVVITTLDEAARTYSGFLTNQWTKALKEDTDPFSVLNLALHRGGLFIYVPSKTVLETPIQLLNIIDAQSAPMLLMPRLQGFIGGQSELKIISTQSHPDQTVAEQIYATNMAADLLVEEDAHVHYTQIVCGAEDNLWHFDALRATLKRNSTLKTVAITDGAATVRHDYRVIMAGENSEAQLNGLWMLSGKREAHTHVYVEHQAPNCRSMQLFKGVLNDFSRSSFEGKIMVRRPAQKTEAFQLNRNLLLSDRAHADSKPNLEIFADDVKASHGATIGQLDKEEIFYMKTRGLSEVAAKNILVYGFCKELIDILPLNTLQKTISARADQFLSEVKG